MTMPILSTKLYIPAPRSKVVTRHHLVNRLNDSQHCKLTLVSAPAGFGKTSLLSEWIANSKQAVAWLSLHADDNDSTRFLIYLISALQTISPDLGKSVLATLQSPQAPSINSILTTLLNDIVTISENFALVLDDYHLIDSIELDNALTFLIEYMPPHMHLIIATREDPQLPLARLRARGELIELRAADLRFTPSEAADFLNQVMGLSLSEQDIATLETRTEGWIAGLQLAAISLQGHHDTNAFIQSFTGSHHFILDYLLEEVLNQQSETVQTFLLYTSILDRICGSLCDAILLEPNISGQSALEYIEQANLFIIPLDNERHWYRYHHLFADLLRQRLQKTENQTISIDELHIRASQWFEDNGLELEAFQHAAKANDSARAERIIHADGKPMYFRGFINPILNWLNSLHSNILENSPSLSLTYAWLITFMGIDTRDIEARLEIVEALVQDAPKDVQTQDIFGQIASIRAMLAIPTNDIEIMISQAGKALELLAPDNAPVRLNTAWTLAFAYQAQGNRVEARKKYNEVIPISEASGNIMISLACVLGLAGIQQSDNQLHEAKETFYHALELAGEPPMPPASVAHLGLGEIDYEWNLLDSAEEHALLSIYLGAQMETVDLPTTGGILLSRVKLARGDVKGAFEAINEAERFVHQRNLMFRLPYIAEIKVLIHLFQDDLESATKLTEEYDIPLSQVRVSLAQDDADSALAILEPRIEFATTKNWKDEQLKLYILQSLALYQSGQLESALQTLALALKLAEASAFIRSFLNEGTVMAELLTEALNRGILPDYVRKLLSSFADEGDDQLSHLASQPLIEPLSERELEVLQLVADGLSNGEIASKLFLALDTVKGHNRRIYAKLQVQRRTEAVARARELGLLSL